MAIASEVSGRAELVSRRYVDPDVARASWPVATFHGTNNCTATMIGPNTMITAAHCGGPTSTVVFRTYRGTAAGAYLLSVSESFSCMQLISGFPWTDLAIHYCPPNSSAEHPGDKYGYLDFDLSTPSKNQAIYSIVAHSVDDLGLTDARLWTDGKIKSTNHRIWPQPGGPIAQKIGIKMNIFGELGVSGSVTLNPDNHRILIGPTSTVNASWEKHALSMKTYLQQASVDSFEDFPGYFSGHLSQLGLNGPDYSGLVDKDSDGLFDVQEDLERVRGENARGWYHLGFESRRRNALWDRNHVSLYTGDAQARISKYFTGPVVLLKHQHLNLEANRTYRISFLLKVTSSGHAQNLLVSLRKKNSILLDDYAHVDTVAGPDWKMVAMNLRTKSNDTVLELASGHGPLSGYVKQLSVVEEGATMDFDSLDTRFHWSYQTREGVGAHVRPDGRASGPNWAGLVRRSPFFSFNSDWGLTNRHLGMVAGQTYKICFDHRYELASAGSPFDWGALRITSSSGTTLQTITFRPARNWQTLCTGYFTAPTSDNQVKFGNRTFSSFSNSSYLVDNVRVVRKLLFPMPTSPQPIQP